MKTLRSLSAKLLRKKSRQFNPLLLKEELHYSVVALKSENQKYSGQIKSAKFSCFYKNEGKAVFIDAECVQSIH
ncbi:MAG: hypothetical protein ACI9M9_001339 [Flavobacteriaceae bacterium]|jgi:hypothetical protein